MPQPVLAKSEALAAALEGAPEVPHDLFTPGFHRRSGTTQVGPILASLREKHGLVERIAVMGPLRPGAWILEWRFSDGARQLHHIMVEASPPHRIGVLLFGPSWNPAEEDVSDPAQTVFKLPFRGEWYVTWGGRTLEANYHRPGVPQRYAYDFSIVRGGSCFEGDGSKNAQHYCFGESILAPAEGVIVEVGDGRPDNDPGDKNEGSPLGNYVVIEHENDEFSFLAHLKYDSVVVSDGDRVAGGEVVGKCGNSGRSSKPHLHFHVQTTKDLATGIGLPVRFVDFRLNGEHRSSAEPAGGDLVERAGDAAVAP